MRQSTCVKRLFLFVISFSFLCVCSIGTAQVYYPPNPIPWTDVVRSPGNEPGSQIGIEALFLRPTSTKLLYVVVDPYEAGPDSVCGTLEGLQHGYAPAFRVIAASAMGSYAGMELAYTHFRTSDDSYAEVGDDEDLWGLLLHPNSVIDDNNVTNIKVESTFSLDQGAICSRVSFGFGSSGNISLSAGLQYTRLKQELDILYRQRTSDTAARRVFFERDNSLSGFGPVFTVGTQWNMGGVTLFGEMGAAMLVSTIKGYVKQHDINSLLSETVRVDVDCEYGPRIVPAASMKLGVGYESRSDWGLFGARFGYEVHNYFNAISTYEQYDDVDSQVGANDQSDIGIDGVFLSLRGSWNFISPL